ncbi:MAG: cell division protein ZapA, partial [Eubacteriales bacterium]
MEKNKVRVNIASKAYTIIGEDSTEHMISVGKMVDSNVREIAENYPALSVSDRAVLAAINIADEHIKSREKLMKMVEELTNSEQILIDRLEELTNEFNTLKASVEEAERRADEAQAQNEAFMAAVAQREADAAEKLELQKEPQAESQE